MSFFEVAYYAAIIALATLQLIIFVMQSVLFKSVDGKAKYRIKIKDLKVKKFEDSTNNCEKLL